MKPNHEDPLAEKKESGFSVSYIEFAKTLRTWFVAYGIGAPVLVLSQESLQAVLKSSEYGRSIALLFLSGVALQIGAALVYKVAMWYLYMGELKPKFCTSLRYRLSGHISEALWLEIVFDLGTIALFGMATWRVLGLVVK